MKNIVPTPVTLTADELKTVIKLVSVRSAEYGAARICRLLAGEHSLTAHDISEASDISNVSDMILRCINPRLKSTDLYIACEKPRKQIIFGGRSTETVLLMILIGQPLISA